MNLSNLSDEEALAKVLALCGFASEPASQSSSWEALQMLHPLPFGRHLTGDAYKNLFVSVKEGVFQIYSWISLICELKGEVSQEQLIEKIELCALPQKAPRDASQCICLELPLPFFHYEEVKSIGVDETLGRFGEVKLRRCLHCGRHWLHYFVEFEAYRKSGRYYMGLITPELAESITPETAADYIGNLDWHLYGGSFFDGETGRSNIKGIYVDC